MHRYREKDIRSHLSRTSKVSGMGVILLSTRLLISDLAKAAGGRQSAGDRQVV